MDSQQKNRILETYCGTCLSKDRKLEKCSKRLRIRCFGSKLVDHLAECKICWECQHTLNRFVKFQKQATEAMCMLEFLFKRSIEDKYVRLQPLSELKQRSKMINININSDTSSSDLNTNSLVKAQASPQSTGGGMEHPPPLCFNTNSLSKAQASQSTGGVMEHPPPRSTPIAVSNPKNNKVIQINQAPVINDKDVKHKPTKIDLENELPCSVFYKKTLEDDDDEIRNRTMRTYYGNTSLYNEKVLPIEYVKLEPFKEHLEQTPNVGNIPELITSMEIKPEPNIAPKPSMTKYPALADILKSKLAKTVRIASPEIPIQLTGANTRPYPYLVVQNPSLTNMKQVDVQNDFIDNTQDEMLANTSNSAKSTLRIVNVQSLAPTVKVTASTGKVTAPIGKVTAPTCKVTSGPPKSLVMNSRNFTPALNTEIAKGPKAIPNVTPRDILVKQIEYDELIALREEERNGDIYQKALFQCERCILGFKDAYLYNCHMLAHNENQGAIPCDLCGMRFKTYKMGDLHRQSHFVAFFCSEPGCKFRSRFRSVVGIHMLTQAHPILPTEGENTAEESIQEKVKEVTDKVKKVKEKVKEVKGKGKEVKRKGKEVKVIAKKVKDIAKEVKDKEVKGIKEGELLVPPCKYKYCGRKFDTYQELIDHEAEKHPRLRKRNNYRASCYKFKCTFKNCKRAFKTKKNQQMHIMEVHEKVTWHCKTCNKTYKSGFSYREHLVYSKNHQNIRKFECDYCGQKCTSKRAISIHINVMHTKMEKYPCEYCKLKFLNPNSKNVHMRLKHTFPAPARKRDPAVCTICGKSYTTQSVLNKHMYLHTGLKPYHCPYCEWKFAQSSTLFTHCRFKHKDLPRPPAKPIIGTPESQQQTETDTGTTEGNKEIDTGTTGNKEIDILEKTIMDIDACTETSETDTGSEDENGSSFSITKRLLGWTEPVTKEKYRKYKKC